MMVKQQGIALIIGLILLVVMTLIAVASTNTSLMEEKMTGNFRDIEIAYNAADTGLRDAEGWLGNQASNPGDNATGSTMIWSLDSGNLDSTATDSVNWWQERNTSTWWAANAQNHTDYSGIAGSMSEVKTKPYSIIEFKYRYEETSGELGDMVGDPVYYYRVTSRATGGSNDSRILMQSTWSRRW